MATERWDYLSNGPDYWKVAYAECGNGQRQSPINIKTSFVEFDTSLKDLKFSDYDSILNWNLTNNGHTGEIN